MEQLLRDGAVKRGYLGIQMDDVDPDTAARIGLQNGGVLTKKVLANSPAAKGGMKVGDVITIVAGKPVKDGRDLQRIVADLPLQKPAGITVLRDGKFIELSIVVLDQPDFDSTPAK